MADVRAKGRREQGFALVLAILALMLLTFLGLTLATTTSQELQIASNYRWSQQALYNAEAGLEYAKAVLRDIDWTTRLYAPIAQAKGWTVVNGSQSPRPAQRLAGVPSGLGAAHARDFENQPCDNRGGAAGFGLVLRDGTGSPIAYRESALNHSINGSFTVWVRRPLAFGDGVIYDSADNDVIILTAEGIAPFRGAAQATTTTAQSLRARKMVEYQVSRRPPGDEDPGAAACATRAGQAGGGAEGANFGGCYEMLGARVAEGLGMSGSVTDTGAE